MYIFILINELPYSKQLKALLNSLIHINNEIDHLKS